MDCNHDDAGALHQDDGLARRLEAQVIFADIGWAPPVKLSDDIGTDLVTFARDDAAPEDKENAWDLGAPVFMQVKGSPTEYLKPANKRKGEPGWWFDESDTYHFDHWLSFGLPYLLVLVDPEPDRVLGRGDRRRDHLHRQGPQDLRPVYPDCRRDQHRGADQDRGLPAQVRPRRDGLGGELNDLGPADRLRTALVLPRLVAPHGNRTIEKVGFEEAVAMVLRNRYSAFSQRARQGQCPKVEDWETHKEWTGGSCTRSTRSSPLAAATDSKNSQRTPGTVSNAMHASSYRPARPTRATGNRTPSTSCSPPWRPSPPTADGSWCRRLRSSSSSTSPRKRSTPPRRPWSPRKRSTVTFPSAPSAARRIHPVRNPGFGAGDLEATITAQDHAGNWWRAQDVSWALEKDLKYRFEGWTANNTIHFINSTARDDLATVAWTAAFSGAWNSWRHLTAMNAKLTFTSTSDPTRVAAALGALIFIGEKKAAKDATRKMWLDGPLDTLHFLVNAIAYREWTKRDEGATMAVLSKAGDLLDAKAADHVVQRILDLLRNEGHVRVHGGAWATAGAKQTRPSPES